jgi:riboflavin kinase/FMN adenylyltransferase
MKVERYPDGVTRDPASVVTIGVFDGVHLGHQAILERVVQRAVETDSLPAVVTFDPHPQEVVAGEIVPLLTTQRERIDLLSGVGISRVIVVRFDEAFSRLAPDEFVEQILFGRIGCREVVLGYDHGFGRGRSGDVGMLRKLAAKLGFEVHEMEARTTDHTPISSSQIRKMLMVEGDVQGVRGLLGRPYSVSGEVIKGDGRGKVIGYPTANIAVGNRRKIIPLRGVYAVRVTVAAEAATHSGMMNIGFRPTFDGAGLRLEVHVFGLDRNLYGDRLQIEFVERIRDERKFDNVEDLKSQLKQDEERCRHALTGVS